LLREEKRGVLSVRRPSCPPPRRGFEGTGPFLSVWRDGGAKLSSRRSKKLREPVALFPLLLVPSSSLLRPRHASPFRRPRSRDYRQRDRSLLASYFTQHQNRDQPSQLALRRPKHKSTTRRHMPRVSHGLERSDMKVQTRTKGGKKRNQKYPARYSSQGLKIETGIERQDS
jgi:hypothetical protein